jgi:hypothetical protein
MPGVCRSADRLAVMVYPSGRTVNITRNANGHVTVVTTKETAAANAANVATGIVWKPMSELVAAMTHGNGLETTAGFDLDYRLTALELVNGPTTGG